MISIILDRKADKPLYAQIRDAIGKAIDEKSLKSGEQLPPVVAFAKDLGVTQTTIRRAFKDLIDTGLVGSHVGRGTFVLEPDENVGEGIKPAEYLYEKMEGTINRPEFMRVARHLRTGIAKSLDSLTCLTKRPGLIKFTSGIPAPDIAAEGILEELTLDALKAGQKKYQEYSMPLGLLALREELAKRYSDAKNPITPDQILITSGSQQAISILAQSALENKQRVICETPCYMGVPESFSSLGHWVESVPRDRQGPLTERLNRYRDGKPTILYLGPALHNPMGTDLSPSRRNFLINWAKEQNALVIADDIFRDLYFKKPPTPSLWGDLGPDHVVVLGSLSKTFMCGLRIGWLIGNSERIRSLGTYKRYMDNGSPPLMEGIALSLLRSGKYDFHLKRARDYYRKRRDAVLEALDRHMPNEVSWTTPKGGFHMWVELPIGYSSIVLFLLAIERGVAFVPGPQLDIDHRFINAFRICYSTLDINQILEGIELLADAVKDLLKDPPNDHGLSGLGDFV